MKDVSADSVGFCTETYREVFRMTDEGAAEALAKENPEEEETANKARKSCPQPLRLRKNRETKKV